MNPGLFYLIWSLIALFAVFHLYSAAVATWHLGRSSHFTGFQKRAQLAIIWLLPLAGVAIVLHMLGPEARNCRPGWVPLLEPIILAAYNQSGPDTMNDFSHDCASTDAMSFHDSGSDCGGGYGD